MLMIVVAEMTDIELQKTNTTLRRLSDEMRSYSIERSKEREEELRLEVDRIHSEIKLLQKTNEDSATISDKLSREVSGGVAADRGVTCQMLRVSQQVQISDCQTMSGIRIGNLALGVKL